MVGLAVDLAVQLVADLETHSLMALEEEEVEVTLGSAMIRQGWRPTVVQIGSLADYTDPVTSARTVLVAAG